MSSRLSGWQRTTLATLLVGYAGYYFCRSNLSVATPLLLEEFGAQGLDKETMGLIASIGVFFYAGGKLVNGTVCDFIGGRKMFLFGMLGSVVATVLFGMGTGVTMFIFAWALNRMIQSMGWGALVKTASRWFPPKRLGTLMGVLALSYLFGDMVAKLVLGELIELGLGWRGVFFAAAGVLSSIAIVAFFTLKSGPSDVGEPEPEANPDNLYGERGNEERPEDLRDLLMPLFKSPSFLLVCVISFGLTVLRETLNFWTPTYLVEVSGMSNGDAAKLSGLFPFFGGLSILLAGFVSDRFTKGRRGGVMFVFLVPATLGIVALAALEPGVSVFYPAVLLSLVGLLMIGPYAFLSGVISVDLGGKRASSTAAGVADAVGYFGSVASGWGVGKLAQEYGWAFAMTVLGALAALTTATAGVYWIVNDLPHVREYILRRSGRV